MSVHAEGRLSYEELWAAASGLAREVLAWTWGVSPPLLPLPSQFLWVVKIVPFYLCRSEPHGKASALHQGFQEAEQGMNSGCNQLPVTHCPPSFSRLSLPVQYSQSSFSPDQYAGGAPGVKLMLEDWCWKVAHSSQILLFSRLHLEGDVVPGKSLTNSLAQGYSHLAMNLHPATANLFTSLGKSVSCSSLLHTLIKSSPSGLIFSVLHFPPLPFVQWDFPAGGNTNSCYQGAPFPPQLAKRAGCPTLFVCERSCELNSTQSSFLVFNIYPPNVSNFLESKVLERQEKQSPWWYLYSRISFPIHMQI